MLTSQPTMLLTCSMSLLDQVSSLTASYSAATRWQVSVLGFSKRRPCRVAQQQGLEAGSRRAASMQASRRCKQRQAK